MVSVVLGTRFGIAKRYYEIVLCILNLLLIGGCSQAVYVRSDAPPSQNIAVPFPPQRADHENAVDSPWRADVLKIAKSLVGKKAMVEPGRKFRRDCSGTVRGIYELAGLSLKAATSRAKQTDTKTIFDYVQQNGEITNESPAIGDLIFFDKTYDFNKDGKWNDPLTHVGVVTEISDDGEIRYVHYSHGRIVESTMQDNLRRNKKNPKGSTGADLFAGFGKLKKT